MKTIVIVEGKSDTRRLKEIYPNIITFQTSGRGLDSEKINSLKKLEASGVELICFTDPDYAGEKIRERLTDELSSLKHAYAARSESYGKRGKIGIESASESEIRKALENTFSISNEVAKYNLAMLQRWGIIGDKARRELFCDKLGIANGNNKKVLKQLNNFNINEDVIKRALGELDES